MSAKAALPRSVKMSVDPELASTGDSGNGAAMEIPVRPSTKAKPAIRRNGVVFTMFVPTFPKNHAYRKLPDIPR